MYSLTARLPAGHPAIPPDIGVTPARMNDSPAVEIVAPAPALAYRKLYADQATNTSLGMPTCRSRS